MYNTRKTSVKTTTGRRIVLLGIAVLVVVGGIYFVSAQQIAIPAGIDEAEFGRARKLYVQRTQLQPNQMDVLSLLGELALHEKNLELAATCFEAIPVTQPKYGLAAKLHAGQIFIRLDRALEAEENFRAFLDHAERALPEDHPDVALARSWLCYLMAAELRFEDRKIVLAEQHAAGSASINDSKQYYFPNLLIWNSSTARERLRAFLKENPDDPQLNIAQGRYLMAEGKLEDAQSHLQEWLSRSSGDLACIAALLECNFERDDWSQIDQLMSVVPAISADEPWLLTLMRGQSALHQKRWEEAESCFNTYLNNDPGSTAACMGLSRALTQLGRAEEAGHVQARLLVLSKIRPQLTDVNQANPAAIEKLARECDELQMRDAAQSFRRHAQVFR